MGGMGFIHSAECDIMHNSALINIHMIGAAAKIGVSRYFFSSSVCVYRDMQPGDPTLDEDDAYSALPDNEYGWEKLYARHYPIQVRVARLQNCYGPEGTWRGGRQKAPAAICRRVAMAEDGGTIPVWGDGTAIRAYTYVDDLVDGIYLWMHTDSAGIPSLSQDVPSVIPSSSRATPRDLAEGSPACVAIIGGDEYVTVDELVQTVTDAPGKHTCVQHVEGPVGVHARNFDKSSIKSLGWRAETSLTEGIAETYAWIETQVKALER
jgi:nucleoside-diphosphate-sugar epimerase